MIEGAEFATRRPTARWIDIVVEWISSWRAECLGRMKIYARVSHGRCRIRTVEEFKVTRKWGGEEKVKFLIIAHVSSPRWMAILVATMQSATSINSGTTWRAVTTDLSDPDFFLRKGWRLRWHEGTLEHFWNSNCLARFRFGGQWPIWVPDTADQVTRRFHTCPIRYLYALLLSKLMLVRTPQTSIW